MAVGWLHFPRFAVWNKISKTSMHSYMGDPRKEKYEHI